VATFGAEQFHLGGAGRIEIDETEVVFAGGVEGPGRQAGASGSRAIELEGLRSHRQSESVITADSKRPFTGAWDGDFGGGVQHNGWVRRNEFLAWKSGVGGGEQPVGAADKIDDRRVRGALADLELGGVQQRESAGEIARTAGGIGRLNQKSAAVEGLALAREDFGGDGIQRGDRFDREWVQRSGRRRDGQAAQRIPDSDEGWAERR